MGGNGPAKVVRGHRMIPAASGHRAPRLLANKGFVFLVAIEWESSTIARNVAWNVDSVVQDCSTHTSVAGVVCGKLEFGPDPGIEDE